MKKNDTWMPLYIGDYLADTAHLTTEQHGAYLLLLMALWKRGGAGLPDVDENLAAAAHVPAARWKAMRRVLVDGVLLRTDGEIVTQKRLADELNRAAKITEARTEAGAKGGANAAAKRQQTDAASGVAKPQQTSTPSQSQETTALRADSLTDPSGHPAPGLFGPEPAPLPAVAAPLEFTGLNAAELNGKAIAKLAATWELPTEWGNDALALGFTAKETLYQAERFRQHFVNEGSRRAVKGWRKSWGYWLGKAAERQR